MYLDSFLKKLNLTEQYTNKISLTNLALFVGIIKIATATQVSFPEIGALLLVILNYSHKRYEACKSAKNEMDKLPNASDVLSQIKTLKEMVSEQAKVLESQGKVVDEAKSIMTAQKIQLSQKRNQL